MEVIVLHERAAAEWLAAALIEQAIRSKPSIVIGLATGRTMEPVYAHLVNWHRCRGLDFSGVKTFNLDEYVGLPGDHPQSYRHYMRHHLFDHVNIRVENTHLPNGCAADLEAECCRYEEEIRRCGGIDLQLLGLGEDGHIGFNEPLSALMSRTRVKALSPKTIEQNSPLFDDPALMPRRAITMGVGTILESHRCIVLVTGAKKADILARAVEGPITAMISATALQLHPRCVYIVDEEASARLTEKEYYNRIFETEPEWETFRQRLENGEPFEVSAT